MIVLPKHKKPFSKKYHRKIKEHHYILLFVSVTLNDATLSNFWGHPLVFAICFVMVLTFTNRAF